VYTGEVEGLFLHAESVGRDTRVVSLELRQEPHDDQRGGRVTGAPLRAVLLHNNTIVDIRLRPRIGDAPGQSVRV